MNIPFSSVAGLLFGGMSALAADPLPTFGGERIGIPPLSLAESASPGTMLPQPSQPATETSRNAGDAEFPVFSPPLVPRQTPTLMRKHSLPPDRHPQIARAAGMPILVPRDDVDYKLKLVPPDPKVDFKLAIKDPGPAFGPKGEADK